MADPHLARDLHNLQGVGFRAVPLSDKMAGCYSHHFASHGCYVQFVRQVESDAWECLIGFPDRPDALVFHVPANTILGFPE